jgi:transcriptional regulator with XRE-family HTH domain
VSDVERDARLAYRDVIGAWCSEGRRLLNVARAGEKLVVLAMRLEVSESYLSELLNGRKQPSIGVATRVFLVFGIEGHTWGLTPTSLGANSECSTGSAASRTTESAA